MPKTGAEWSKGEDTRLTELLEERGVPDGYTWSWHDVAEALMATPRLAHYYSNLGCVREGRQCRERCALPSPLPQLPSLPTCAATKALHGLDWVLPPPTLLPSSHPPNARCHSPILSAFPRWAWRRWEGILTPDAWKRGDEWGEQEVLLTLALTLTLTLTLTRTPTTASRRC